MGNQCNVCMDPHNTQFSGDEYQKTILLGIEDQKFIRHFHQTIISIKDLSGLKIANKVIQTIQNQSNSQKNIESSSIWKIIFPQRCYFIGTIQKNKLPKGFCKIYLADQENQFEGYYQGQINNFQANDNSALYVMNDSSFYIGSIKKNKAQGIGKYINLEKNIQYEGQWKNNLPHGNGIYKSALETYKGHFINGLKNGQGEHQWVGGSIYKGQFKQGKMNGKGVLKSKGCTYTGDMLNGLEDGNGQWQGFNQKYIGKFKQGKRQGQGKFIFETGSVYQGQFKNDKPNGNGKLIKNYEQFLGIWINGKNVCIFDK